MPLMNPPSSPSKILVEVPLPTPVQQQPAQAAAPKPKPKPPEPKQAEFVPVKNPPSVMILPYSMPAKQVEGEGQTRQRMSRKGKPVKFSAGVGDIDRMVSFANDHESDPGLPFHAAFADALMEANYPLGHKIHEHHIKAIQEGAHPLMGNLANGMFYDPGFASWQGVMRDSISKHVHSDPSIRQRIESQRLARNRLLAVPKSTPFIEMTDKNGIGHSMFLWDQCLYDDGTHAVDLVHGTVSRDGKHAIHYNFHMPIAEAMEHIHAHRELLPDSEAGDHQRQQIDRQMDLLRQDHDAVRAHHAANSTPPERMSRKGKPIKFSVPTDGVKGLASFARKHGGDPGVPFHAAFADALMDAGYPLGEKIHEHHIKAIHDGAHPLMGNLPGSMFFTPASNFEQTKSQNEINSEIDSDPRLKQRISANRWAAENAREILEGHRGHSFFAHFTDANGIGHGLSVVDHKLHGDGSVSVTLQHSVGLRTNGNPFYHFHMPVAEAVEYLSAHRGLIPDGEAGDRDRRRLDDAIGALQANHEILKAHRDTDQPERMARTGRPLRFRREAYGPLVAAVSKDPYDDVSQAALADYLMESGHPAGDLIASRLAAEAEGHLEQLQPNYHWADYRNSPIRPIDGYVSKDPLGSNAVKLPGNVGEVVTRYLGRSSEGRHKLLVRHYAAGQMASHLPYAVGPKASHMFEVNDAEMHDYAKRLLHSRDGEHAGSNLMRLAFPDGPPQAAAEKMSRKGRPIKFSRNAYRAVVGAIGRYPYEDASHAALADMLIEQGHPVGDLLASRLNANHEDESGIGNQQYWDWRGNNIGTPAVSVAEERRHGGKLSRYLGKTDHELGGMTFFHIPWAGVVNDPKHVIHVFHLGGDRLAGHCFEMPEAELKAFAKRLAKHPGAESVGKAILRRLKTKPWMSRQEREREEVEQLRDQAHQDRPDERMSRKGKPIKFSAGDVKQLISFAHKHGGDPGTTFHAAFADALMENGYPLGEKINEHHLKAIHDGAHPLMGNLVGDMFFHQQDQDQWRASRSLCQDAVGKNSKLKKKYKQKQQAKFRTRGTWLTRVYGADLFDLNNIHHVLGVGDYHLYRDGTPAVDLSHFALCERTGSHVDYSFHMPIPEAIDYLLDHQRLLRDEEPGQGTETGQQSINRMVSGLKANYDALKAHYADKYANKSDPPPERMSRYRSPAGGMLVRGLFYPGGKMVPKEATEAKPAPSSKPVEPAGPKPKPKPDRKQSAKRKRKKPSGNAEGRDPFF